MPRRLGLVHQGLPRCCNRSDVAGSPQCPGVGKAMEAEIGSYRDVKLVAQGLDKIAKRAPNANQREKTPSSCMCRTPNIPTYTLDRSITPRDSAKSRAVYTSSLGRDQIGLYRIKLPIAPKCHPGGENTIGLHVQVPRHTHLHTTQVDHTQGHC